MSQQSRKPASPDKGEAARVEKAPQPKKLTWRGLKLTLPATVATMRLTATWRRLGKAAEAEDGRATMNYLVDIVDIVLDGDERQADQVWTKIDEDAKAGNDAAEAVFDLVDKATDLYGVAAGE